MAHAEVAGGVVRAVSPQHERDHWGHDSPSSASVSPVGDGPTRRPGLEDGMSQHMQSAQTDWLDTRAALPAKLPCSSPGRPMTARLPSLYSGSTEPAARRWKPQGASLLNVKVKGSVSGGAASCPSAGTWRLSQEAGPQHGRWGLRATGVKGDPAQPVLPFGSGLEPPCSHVVAELDARPALPAVRPLQPPWVHLVSLFLRQTRR